MDSEMSQAAFELLREKYSRDHFFYISQSGVSSLLSSSVYLSDSNDSFNSMHRFGWLSSVMWMIYNAMQLACEFPELIVH